MYRKLLLLGMAFYLCGCRHQAAYQRPAPPLPESWPKGAAVQASAADVPEAASVSWREFFADRRLQSVIELALANNRDLRIATLNIERIQALYRIQRAEQFPTVGVSASGDLYRLPKSVGFAGLTAPEAVTVQQYNINLGSASWELDFFGRVRSLKSAALERFLATEQARSATQIALVAAVANSYLALAADRENLRLAQDTLATQQASYELILRTREAGMASDLDVRQARSQVEAARVDIARYTGQVELDENALNLLAGTTVPANLLPGDLDSAGSLRDVRAGLPSEVLLRRPDILLAEHQLKAAYANIGAARAAFFPRIALTAGAGLMSADLSDLFKFGATTWNFAPQVALPIFDAGARKANLKVTEVDREAATAEYEKAIQSAFREVSDSLSLKTRLMEQQNAQQELVKSVVAAHRLSEARYKAGIDSYLSVLVAQRLMYSAQQGLISLRMARLGNLITLYKVLGGGA
ncbi:MAG: efflux transporter outer membrane subunit [Bryobacteraceae bacterium]|nr:efflux transporter outer membrane subunit [Bryobacterales bacterium]MEB2359926.1 efflux transporter outer membrane subunit [Bryobacterales bacterium]NUN01777.1 efflux transporter outer membrane subunit [Bryobacteraceae bacterium]